MSTRKSLEKSTLLAPLSLLLAGCSIGSIFPSPTPTPLPSGMVDVGGYSLYYECSGQGSPTVILESGGGADSS
jgi:hypothetical protein